VRFHLSKCARVAASKAILVTGSARSGTTIMGKVVHSLYGVEYAYEPPMLFALLPMISSMPEDDWRLLYETYLYEEFLLNVLAGRAINCNRVDDSSIYRVKSPAEIEDRLKKSLPKAQAEKRATNHIVAYKLPDVVPFLPALQDHYPSMRIVVMLRDAMETLNSLLKKGWFSRENETSALIWPFRRYEGIHVPFWVREGEDALWAELPEIDRAAYYYIRVNEDVPKINNRIEVRYARLLAAPREVVGEVADFLGLQFGAMTDAIIETIRPTQPDRDKHILARIAPEFREVVERYSEYSF